MILLSKWTGLAKRIGRGESRRVPSMNCVRNELMNVILVWLPWLLNYTKSYCTTRTHVYYIHMCVHIHVLHQLLFLFLCMYISFVPLLFNIPIITSSGWTNITLCKRITSPSNILMPFLLLEKYDNINPQSNLAA